MSRKSTFAAAVAAVGIVLVSGFLGATVVAQKSARQLELEIAQTLDELDREFEAMSPVRTASFNSTEGTVPPCLAAKDVADCPNCDCERDGSCPACPGNQPQLDCDVVMIEHGNPSHANFIQNKHYSSPAFALCDELAGTMAECLSDSNIPQESRRKILQTTMKLLVRNAELESQTQVARIQLEHERELAEMRGNLLQMQSQMASAGEIKTWMGPLYTNQNQTQQQMNNLMTNLQLVNRTLRLLEKEKDASDRLQANQPLPAGFVSPQQPQVQPRPERWSQLPSHSQPRPTSESTDHTTQSSQPHDRGMFMSRSSRVAPPRLTDEAVRRQQLQSHMRQLQAELDRANHQVRAVGWEQPITGKQTIPGANQLRPMQQPNQNR